MSEVLGSAILRLTTDAAGLERGLADAQAQTTRSIQDIAATAAKVGGALSVGLTTPLVALGRSSLLAYQESERAVAGLRAGLESMGPAAGRTEDQLLALAQTMERSLAVDGDLIIGRVVNNLLTFGNIADEQFDRATKAAVDLSARLGTDLQGSAIMVGRALNDPIRGVTALQRVGVAFTEQQREQIKAMTEAGDVAGAQRIILAELEKQYGGQAAAMAATTSGQMAALALAWEGFSEQIGRIIAEVLPPLTQALTGVVTWLASLDESTLRWIVTIGAVAAAVGPALIAFAGVASALGTIIPIIAAVGKALVVLIAATGPIGLTIAALIALQAVWVIWGDEISAVVRRLADFIGQTMTRILDLVTGKMAALRDRVLGAWRAVTDGAQRMYDRLVGRSIIPDLVREAHTWFGRLSTSADESMRAVGASIGHASGAARDFGSIAGRAFDALGQRGVSLSGVLRQVADDVQRLMIRRAVTEPLTNAIGGWLGEAFAGMFRADGGPVSAGRSYIVGERGPELFTPRAGGHITPSHQLGRAGGGNVYNIDARGADQTGLARLETLIVQLHGSIEHRAVAAVLDARQRGGTFAGAFA